MPIFACVWYSSWLKAREVTNRDIVNPMDARKPSPSRLRIFIPSGNWAIFSLIKTAVKPTTPTTFPTNNPNATPNAILVSNKLLRSIFNDTPALAIAKIGMITKVTTGCIACSNI